MPGLSPRWSPRLAQSAAAAVAAAGLTPRGESGGNGGVLQNEGGPSIYVFCFLTLEIDIQSYIFLKCGAFQLYFGGSKFLDYRVIQ